MRLSVLVLALLPLLVSPDTDVYIPAQDCTTACDGAHKCLSTENGCVERWDNCIDEEQGLDMVQMSKSMEFDEQDCYQNGCTFGGCDTPGYGEQSKESCDNIDLFCVFCYNERCCKLREWVRCCPKLDCVKELAGCPDVPQQEASISSESSIYYTKLADGGSVVFPFYRTSEVPAGQACESVRVLGACSCSDGSKQPGCDAQDSASWAAWNGTHVQSGLSLPANLSLTCTELAPPINVAPPPSLPDGGGAAGAANGTAVTPGEQSSVAPHAAEPTAGDAPATVPEGATGSAADAATETQGGIEGGGEGGDKQSGAVVAVSVLLSFVAVGVVAVGTFVLCKRRQQKHVRQSEAYQAMLTGMSYSSPHTPPIRPQASGIRAAVLRLLGRGQRQAQDDPSLYVLEGLEDGTSLQEPAAPDDEVFGVQDLERNNRNRHDGSWNASKGHGSKPQELEMQERGEEQTHLLRNGSSAADITTHEFSLPEAGNNTTERNLQRPGTPPPTSGNARLSSRHSPS